MVIPLHGTVDRSAYDLKPVAAFSLSHVDGQIPAEVYETKIDDLQVYFISGPPLDPGLPVYSPDNEVDGKKFTFFSLAALELARSLRWPPDVLHANDWHTSPAVYALKLKRDHDAFFRHTASLLTVHNLPYLGVGAEQALQSFGLPADNKGLLPRWARQVPLALGLLAADHINAVSPGYAAEMLTPEFGAGLQDFLSTRKESISGILNGIDVNGWDPATDAVLGTNYDNKSLKERIKNKLALQAELDFGANPRIPLFGMVTRMDYQKGIDIALEALRQVAGLPWRAVILGTGNPRDEEETRRLETEFPKKVRAINRFDAKLARRIYAGADAMLIPSRYEPCGLTQMIAMRYGCVPIARATGGLRDTIVDYEGANVGTGFLFPDATPESMAGALRRALEAFNDQRRWRGLQLRGMRQDFSWERSAKAYYSRYLDLVEDRRQLLDGSNGEGNAL
jgi:starch synthase